MDRTHSTDVAILGGGLAGLTLARQLRQELPELSVSVFERTERPLPEGCHKVGESSVELGSQYLERLGLTDYLLKHHLVKFGLRFFPGGGERPLLERAELGPASEPVVRSYQLDRGRFESDLRQMNVDDGVHLFEGATVREITLGPGETPHTIVAETGTDEDTTPITVTSRWVIDATGRNALLKRRLKMRRGTRHAGNASWFRVDGRVVPSDLVPDDGSPEATEWHGQGFASERWRSTNHFMGRGYWVWLIPLSCNMTSVGVVTHDAEHGFDEVRTLERTMAFLEKNEPHLAARLKDATVRDFGCLSGYSHGVARSWSTDRWGIVGEAGAFVDPLYSPGTDYIAFTNVFTSELIRVDLAGEDLDFRVRELNMQYRALVAGALGVFREAAPVYGHARAMTTKIYFDNFAYWSFPCQYFLQNIHRVTGELHLTVTVVGGRFVELSNYVQALMRSWAELAPEEPSPGFVGMPQFPSLAVDAHLALQMPMAPEDTLDYLHMRVDEAEAMVRELVIRRLVEMGPEVGWQVLEAAGFPSWELRIPQSRLEAEDTVGLARRRALDPVARDIERNLGRVTRHPDWKAALQRLIPLPTLAQSAQ